MRGVNPALLDLQGAGEGGGSAAVPQLVLSSVLADSKESVPPPVKLVQVNAVMPLELAFMSKVAALPME